jgi:LacI family transcriptional regulator
MSTAVPQDAGARPATSVDIARAVGLSQATVSRALNGGVVSEAARERILVAARDLGYRPNDVARGLKTRRTGVIGVVVSDILNPFYPEFLQALGSALTVRGERMLLQSGAGAGAEDREAEAVEALIRRRVDGIIATGATDASATLRELAASGYPVVLAHRTLPIDADTIESDNVAGAARVAGLLHSHGHRDVAVIAGDPGASTAQQRAIGFERRAAELGMTVRHEPGGFDADAASGAAMRVLGSGSRPTAVFGHNDTIAIAVLNVARRLGIDVPGELAVVGFDDIAAAGWPIVGLSTVRQPTAALAERAVELLTARLQEPDAAPRHEVLPIELVERTTTGPLRRTS